MNPPEYVLILIFHGKADISGYNKSINSVENDRPIGSLLNGANPK
jgi:hypothetical protein